MPDLANHQKTFYKEHQGQIPNFSQSRPRDNQMYRLSEVSDYDQNLRQRNSEPCAIDYIVMLKNHTSLQKYKETIFAEEPRRMSLEQKIL